MDIISHGLYGGVAFGRANRKSFLLSFLFGIAPDLFSFGLFTAGTWIGLFDHPDWSSGQHPDPSAIPQFVHMLYNWTHSLVIFALVFGLVWLLRKKPLYELLAWPLHILVDIPTHSDTFFPTPFLWPLSDYRINGHPWSSPEIFIPNVILLISLYLWFYVIKPRRQKNKSARQKEEKVL